MKENTYPGIDARPYQIGFDRICFSLRAGMRIVPRELPESIPSVERERLALVSMKPRRPITGMPYGRTAVYADPAGKVQVQWMLDPASRYHPAAIAIVRPLRLTLLRIPEVMEVARSLEAAVNGPLTLSSIEIAADFPHGDIAPSCLAPYLWVRRVSRRRTVGVGATQTSYWGAPSSSAFLKLYEKREDGLRAVRLELTMKRPTLQSLGVGSAENLPNVFWDRVYAQRARFLAISRRHRRDTPLTRSCLEAFRRCGVEAVRAELGRRGMSWLNRNTVSAPIQLHIEEALRLMRSHHPLPALDPRRCAAA